MYLRPATLTEALSARAEHPGALVLAGATAATPALATGGRPPAALLDLAGVRDVAALDEAAGRIRLGPLVTAERLAAQPTLGPDRLPLRGFATPAVRARATALGNLFQRPHDLAAPLAALAGEVEVAHADGARRTVDVPALVTVPGRLAEAAELAVALTVAVPHRFAYARVAVRPAAAPTLAAVAVALLDDGPRVYIVTVTAPVPARRAAAERLLLDAGAGEEFAAAAAAGLPADAPAGQADPAYLATAVRALARRCHRRCHGRPDHD
ncbi:MULTISPECIES: FAD binding domain-containing protein [unclassified Pseudofrankia]|uniref:FAD binding domain-containing protein n=1 Tax=unclassified Pseudofrankia TaxID=2994372 RepID=UPI0008D9B348|nr:MULTISPECIES: FAD binding domain-containing protein [unclassified Pseudofrankia]MDT3438216.1 FAD binding domain-containing protein [Pseudofrankia sp. BMG5.37]OHV46555.1 hypothetical protein BCD48_20755 [Pseudofrankia sp. BMG5.36]